MKFWKILKSQIEETLPDWRDQFISYKELKKLLKLIDPQVGDDPSNNSQRLRLAGDSADGGDSMTKEQVYFIHQFQAQIDKFNDFFIEKEEGYIIKQKELQDWADQEMDSAEELMQLWKEIVDLHGEMVLLENYSALNYTGLVKILKKYEKRTGTSIRLSFIQNILQQPFFATDVLNKLVKECETMLDRFFPASGSSITKPHLDGQEAKPTTERSNLLKWPKELAEIEDTESSYIKSTMSALRVLKEIRSRSSTVSVFSLPPLHGDLEESPSNIP